jgi:peroxiredoxin
MENPLMRFTRKTLSTLVLGLAVIAFAAAAGPAEKSKTKAEIGEPAPSWTLKDTKGNSHSLSDFEGKTVVIEWTNPDCPYIQGVYGRKVVENTINAMKKMGDDYVYLAINSTANKPKSDVIAINDKEHNVDIPVLVDYDGKIGKAYGAKTTPHMYVIDSKGVLRYHGAFTDDPRGSKGDDATNYVLNALKQMKKGETVAPDHARQWGCSVKYARK